MVILTANKSNFDEVCEDFFFYLPKSAYICIDEEMSGIWQPPSEHNQQSQYKKKANNNRMATNVSKEDTPSERYKKEFQVIAEKYSILQVGIVLFFEKDNYVDNNDDCISISNNNDEDEEGGVEYDYKTRMYKFYISKNDEFDITFNTSSMRFLSEHGLSIDKWLHESIPFCTSEEYTTINNKFQSRMRRLNRNSNITPTRQEDIDFLNSSLDSLKEWLDTNEDNDNDYFEHNIFLFPPCNSFRRRLLYEKIPEKINHPNLILEPCKSEPTQIQASISFDGSSSSKIKKEQLMTDRWIESLTNNVGFYAIFKALSDVCKGELKLYCYTTQQTEDGDDDGDNCSKNFITPLEMPSLPHQDDADASDDEAIKFKRHKKLIYPPSSSMHNEQRPIPIIVHNGVMDLLFLMSHLHSKKLPSTWNQAKQLIHSYFPNIYDTKYMAVERCSAFMTFTNGTALQPLYQYLCCRSNNHPDDNKNGTIDDPKQPQCYNSSTNTTIPYGTTTTTSIQPMPKHEEDSNHASAACDAYMTGYIFLKLSKLLIHHQSNVSFQKFLQNNNDILCINKLHCTNSFFTIHLQTQQQDSFSCNIDPNTIYHVSDLDTNVRKIDVQLALEKYVKIFRIFMIDHNNAFFVYCKEDSSLIFLALRRRFPRQKIMTLNDLMLQKLQLEKQEEVKGRNIVNNKVDDCEVVVKNDFSNMCANVALSVRSFLFRRKRKRSMDE